VIEGTLARATAAFRGRFGRSPTHAAQAPGRVNLIGEHTDYNGGFVLPMAIDRACVGLAAAHEGSGRGTVLAVDIGQTWEVDDSVDLTTLPRGDWRRYVGGVMRSFARANGLARLPRIDVALASDVPLGAGLSSSAALEVCLATLLEGVTGARLDPPDKARLCRRAEHEFAEVPCGIMDQFIAVAGRAGHALLIDCRDETAELVSLPAESEAVVLVIDSRVRHELAAGAYAARRASCESAAGLLGVGLLREAGRVGPAQLAALPDEEARCATHVVGEIARTLDAAAALRRNDPAAVGALMSASHASLRDDFRISCPELDLLVEAVGDVPGVFGARMTGGGFGGCVVALVAPGAAAKAGAAARSAYARAYSREPGVFIARSAAGAGPIAV